MRCYVVKGAGYRRYASTNADARSTREQLVDLSGAKKKEFEIEQIDVSLAKPDLLEFINDLCIKLDPRK